MTRKDSVSVSDVFGAAAALIKRNGWRSGDRTGRPSTGFCTVEALDRALYDLTGLTHADGAQYQELMDPAWDRLFRKVGTNPVSWTTRRVAPRRR